MITLPSNYTLAWNQDFSAASYSPFNQPANVSLAGPPGSIWMGESKAGTATNPSAREFDGTEADPYSTSKGYLSIYTDGSVPDGGQLRASDSDGNVTHPMTAGFHAGNAYWECRMFLPNASCVWQLRWFKGDSGSETPDGLWPEIDIAEYGYQLNFHVWDANGADKGALISPASQNVNNISPGFHTWALWCQPTGHVSVYLDGALIYDAVGSPAYSQPIYPILRNLYNIGGGPGQGN